MNKKAFIEAYREARRTLHIFAPTSTYTDKPVASVEERRRAEDRWQRDIRSEKAPAYRAVVDGMRGEAQPLSTGALFAYRNGLYYSRSTSWQGWVKEKLSEKLARAA